MNPRRREVNVKPDNVEATALDTVLLSGVLGMAKAVKTNKSLSASFASLDRALASGRVPATGKVNERLVRSAFSALTRAAMDNDGEDATRLDRLPNPFPLPHNLSWYFGACHCPDEVRLFATAIRHRPLRIWSVARDADGWKVLIQVFGSDNKTEATAQVEQVVDMPKKRLRSHAIASIESFTMKPANVEDFMHEFARGLLAREGLGHFVEISLDSRG